MLLSSLHSAADRPFVLGLSVPAHWEAGRRSDAPAMALVQRALERGFDFLLAPQYLTALFAPAVVARCAIPGAQKPFDAGARDLIWLRRSEMSAEGGAVVTASLESFDRRHAPFLKQQLAALRAAGKGSEERCVLLEIEMGRGASSAQSEEDDTLESFMISLGKNVASVERPSAASSSKIDAQEISEFLPFVQHLGYDGICLALTDPLDDPPILENPAACLARAV